VFKALVVLVVHKVRRAHREPLYRELLVLKEPQEHRESKELVGHKAHKELLVHKVLMAITERKEHREQQVHKELQVHRVQQVPKEL
jgi:hypothetical protein